jgi:hypothetical protein
MLGLDTTPPQAKIIPEELARLSAYDRHRIVLLNARGFTGGEGHGRTLAEFFGVSRETILAVLQGKVSYGKWW